MAINKSTGHSCSPDGMRVRQLTEWAFSYPVAPGYANGCSSGAAAARAFVKALKNDATGFTGGSLQHAVLLLAEDLQRAGDEEARAAIRGKIGGAFAEVERWLRFAAKHATTQEFERATLESLEDELQGAADGVPGRMWAERARKERSQLARDAANTRWAKHRAAEALARAMK